MKALQGSLSCAQPCSRHHSSTGHNTVGCLYWREDHELDCVLQRESHYQPLPCQAAWKTASANCIMPLDVPSSGMAGPQGWHLDREEARSPPSQHGKAQESCCVGKKTPCLSPGKELCCSGVTSDAQSCGHGSEGAQRGSKMQCRALGST